MTIYRPPSFSAQVFCVEFGELLLRQHFNSAPVSLNLIGGCSLLLWIAGTKGVASLVPSPGDSMPVHYFPIERLTNSLVQCNAMSVDAININKNKYAAFFKGQMENIRLHLTCQLLSRLFRSPNREKR